MKQTWKKFLIIPLLLVIAIAPVRGDDANDASAPTPAPGATNDDTSSVSASPVSGIGVSLKVDDNGHIKILSLQPGKPAAKTKKIKVGDRLIAIAEGTNEPMDVANLSLDEVAEKIRGPQGSLVSLTLLPGDRIDAKQIVVPVTRGEFDHAAKNVRRPQSSPHSPENAIQITPSHIHLGGGGDGNDVDIDVPNFGDGESHFFGGVSFLAAAIAIVGTVVPFLTLFLIVAIFFKGRQRRNQELHATLRSMIEKGVPIPPELIVPPDRIRRRVASDLRTGLVILAIGAGVMLITARVGIIVLLVGVAFLVTWKIEKKNTENK